MLEVADLECVRGDRQLFTAMSFSVQPRELLHVHGPNGSGKTSLLRLVCGLTLIMYPYFIANVYLLVATGAVLVAIPYFVRL